MHRRFLVAGLALLPLCAPSDTRGQTDRPAGLDSVLARFDAGDRIRVAFGAQSELRGRLLSVGTDSVSISVDGVPAGAALDAIEGVWSRGTSAGRGALVGGLAGFALGATYGLLIGEIACAETSCSRFEVGAVGGLVVGAGGAGAGALIGLAIPTWRRRYP